MTQAQIDDLQRQIQSVTDIEDISDGFHTFKSLYHQRLYLFAALVKAYKNLAWKSTRHQDGELCFGGGWFIVGITTPLGDYTYHYELKDWDLFDCKVLNKAPEFDGHTDKDVTRVLTLQACYASHWIPVEERLPEDNTQVLAYNGKFNEVHLVDYRSGIFEDYYGAFNKGIITHWMPIVPPRKEEKK